MLEEGEHKLIILNAKINIRALARKKHFVEKQVSNASLEGTSKVFLPIAL